MHKIIYLLFINDDYIVYLLNSLTRLFYSFQFYLFLFKICKECVIKCIKQYNYI